MQIKLTHNTDTNVTLHIVTDSKTMDSIKANVVKRLGNDVKVAGFRPGKAPAELIEKNLDQTSLQTEFINNVMDFAYAQAIEKEKLRTAGEPQVSIKKFVPFTTFEFEVTVDVLGDIKLADYKKISMKPTSVSISTDQVNEVIKSLQQRLAEKKVVERAAKNGDEVVIDFKGVDDKGKAINGADGNDYPLTLGSDNFIPGFESNVIGLKPGQEKTFTIPFPKDYGVAALQGKKVTFTVTAKTINELVLPKIDDSFAAKAGPFTTLKDLKADIKKQLGIEKQNEADREFENNLLRAIAKKSNVAIPTSVIDDQVLRMEREEKQNLTYRGQTWQEHLDAEGVTEEEHRKRNHPDAEEQVKIGILLASISEQEKIQVSAEEVEIRIQLLKGQYQDPTMQAELDKPEARQDIANRIATEKIVAKLRDYATKKP